MMVRVENVTRGAVLAHNAQVADNIVTRFLGLQGRARLDEGHGMVIRPCSGIHTMFMRFPIDVLYVNKEDRVVHVEAAIPPWRVGRVMRVSHYVVELPAGTAARTGTQVGDQIALR
jgi:uncharacterized membrane protein (UPF0127 family)